MNTDLKLKVTEIQRFCMHDGPGVRTTVFMKGCPLSCAWCHNPETQRMSSELLYYDKKCIGCRLCERVCGSKAHIFSDNHILDRERCSACGRCAGECPSGALELCGMEYTVDELLSVITRDREFYREQGGVTLSGGEPLMQGEGAVGLLRACKEEGISTAVETCGYVDRDTLLAALPYTDLFLFDIKDTNDERHRRYTGVSNGRIIENLREIDRHRGRTRLRCILVNGVNTDEEHYRSVSALSESLSFCEGGEVIPYHAYGGGKATFIGRSDNGRREWIPTEEQITLAREKIRFKRG
ncbi:MAG: glycyl-radical enzyme activating protein [Ruminococcaceae bacterium]|nr:glycyl-radical enzyme activating protein [Oscillospiraceae bacterium]